MISDTLTYTPIRRSVTDANEAGDDNCKSSPDGGDAHSNATVNEDVSHPRLPLKKRGLALTPIKANSPRLNSSTDCKRNSFNSGPDVGDENENARFDESPIFCRRSVRRKVQSIVSKGKKNCRKVKTAKKISQNRPRPKHKVGRWPIDERKAFLRGLKQHGRGKWSRIAKDIPTR